MPPAAVIISWTVSIGRKALGSSGTKAAPPAFSSLLRISFSTAATSFKGAFRGLPLNIRSYIPNLSASVLATESTSSLRPLAKWRSRTRPLVSSSVNFRKSILKPALTSSRWSFSLAHIFSTCAFDSRLTSESIRASFPLSFTGYASPLPLKYVLPGLLGSFTLSPAFWSSAFNEMNSMLKSGYSLLFEHSSSHSL